MKIPIMLPEWINELWNLSENEYDYFEAFVLSFILQPII
jgi:hypothetical protein